MRSKQRPAIAGIQHGILIGTFLVVLLVCTGCVLAQKAGKPKKASVGSSAPLLLTAKTDKAAYPSGAEIQFTLTVKNTTKKPLVLHFRNGQRYDFELRKDKDTKLWQWSQGRMFIMSLGSSTVQPGASLTFAEKYHPGGAGMPALPPGTYTLIATLTTEGKSVPAATTTFKVAAQGSE